MCSFCNQHPETILHLFYYYEKVKTFLTNLKTWLKRKAKLILKLTVKNLLFSKQVHNVLLKYLSLLEKYHIYHTRFFSNQISMENFIIYIRKKFQNEKYIAKLQQTRYIYCKMISSISYIRGAITM